MTRLNISVHRDFSKFAPASERPIRRTRAEIDANRPESAVPAWLLLIASVAALAILAQLIPANDAWRLLRLWR